MQPADSHGAVRQKTRPAISVVVACTLNLFFRLHGSWVPLRSRRLVASPRLERPESPAGEREEGREQGGRAGPGPNICQHNNHVFPYACFGSFFARPSIGPAARSSPPPSPPATADRDLTAAPRRPAVRLVQSRETFKRGNGETHQAPPSTTSPPRPVPFRGHAFRRSAPAGRFHDDSSHVTSNTDNHI